jgi:hypothetical protein
MIRLLRDVIFACSAMTLAFFIARIWVIFRERRLAPWRYRWLRKARKVLYPQGGKDDELPLAMLGLLVSLSGVAGRFSASLP